MNHVQGEIKLYLAENTELTEEEFCQKFCKDNIVSASLHLVLSNGEVHKLSVMDVLRLLWERFEHDEDDEELVEIKKSPSCEPDDHNIKITI